MTSSLEIQYNDKLEELENSFLKSSSLNGLSPPVKLVAMI
jgi:hypothetical protein